MTALAQLRAMQQAPAAIGPQTAAGPGFALLRRCLGESGFGPKVWLTMDDSQLSAPSQNLTDVLMQYQRSHGLDADGVCGNDTWSRLAGYDPAAWGQPAALAATSAEDKLRAAFAAKALSYNGIREDPLGSNRGPEVDIFLKYAGFVDAQGNALAQPWCGCFLRYCLGVSAQGLGVAVPFKINPLVSAIVTQAKTQNRLIPASLARKGDLWIWKDVSSGQPRYRHVEVCTGPVGANGKVPTMGGNTGDGSIHEGDGAYKRSRTAAGNLFVDVCRG
jgi:hypothetical protein